MCICFNNSVFPFKWSFRMCVCFNKSVFPFKWSIQKVNHWNGFFVSWMRIEGRMCFWMVYSNAPILITTHSTIFSIQMSLIPIITHSTISIQIHTFIWKPTNEFSPLFFGWDYYYYYYFGLLPSTNFIEECHFGGKNFHILLGMSTTLFKKTFEDAIVQSY